jgi:hypothetical protein
MSFQINADQQRIEASGAKPTGNWTNATYSRTAGGVGNIVSVAHGIIGIEKLYLDFTSGGEVDGVFTVTKVDDDNLSFVGSANSVITAGAGVSYKRVRSLSIQGDESLEISVGTGALEKDAIFVGKNAQENIRVGVNTNNPEFELDVEGQIRTTRSIISDTAQVTNLDIDTIINPALNLRAPNLINFEDTDVTSPTFGTTFFPTADTPPLSDQSRRVATTDFVYQVATNDTGGRVYVSQTIGSDLNDGRSAARPVKTIKKAAQIAYGLQKATPDPTDEYVSIIVSGGEYLEDNPISLPRNCSLVGDNLRRVIVRPLNQDRHMIKASNETYVIGVVFRDALQNSSDPQSTVIHTWKYAFVFDDKQRLYYEPEVQQIPAVPGDKYRGENIFNITFNNHTGDNVTLQTGYFVQGGSSGTQGTVQSVTFNGPVASPYSTGSAVVLITSGINDVFQDAEKVFYDATSLANIITDENNPSVSDRFDVVDAESLRPELETISNQIYQHTIDTEIETVSFRGSTNYVDTTLNRITIAGHGFTTGDQVLYSKDENTNPLPGLIDGTRYWVRVISDSVIELYDLEINAVANVAITQGIKDLTGVSPDDKLHELTTGNVMIDDNHIYVTNHQFTTGDGVVYRAGKMGGIGGLVDGTAYFVYVESDNWFRLAASQANATNKDASGNDAPITLPLTSAGLGFQRFELQNKILSITTIDTSTNTIATYNGPIFTLASSSVSSDFHDYEVGQEVNVYGFQNTAINFGTGTNSSYSITGGLITVQVTGVDNTLTSAFFGNMATLTQAGVTFNFPGADARFSKTYLIGNWSTGSGTPSLPGNSDLGLGYARYNSSNTTITFVLKQANIDTASDVTTSSGTGVSILDNLEDLNGRKYITHRIERADGYSLQFVIRANLSQIGTAINPTGNQSVVGSNNYVLASLRNSPFGFTKINQSDRFRDGAENIKNNQEFIAEEAVGYVKYYYESSLSRGTALTIGGTNFGQVAATVARSVTSWSITGDKATIKIQKGHNLYPSFSQHTPTAASYTPATGILEVTITGHGFSNGDLIKFDAGALVFTCTTDSNQSEHPYPRGSDPAFDKWLAISNKTNDTFEVNVGVSSDTSTHTLVSAGTNSLKKALTSAVTFTGTGNATLNGTHGISDIYDDREFTVDLPDSTQNGQSGTGGTFTDLQQPFRTPNSKDQGNKYGDVAELLFGNADMIADWAVNKMLANNGGYSIPTGSTACYDDVRDFIQKCVAHNLKWGGNDRVFDQAKFYIDPGFSLTRDRYVEVFNNAKDACILAGRNLPIYRSTYATKLQYYHNATLDVGAGTVRRDAATLIQKNLEFIAFEAVQQYNIDNPSHNVPGGNQNCIDDALDILRTVVYNLAYGGNEQVYDAAELYTNSTFLDGEETESRAVFALVNTIAKQVLESQTVTVEGNHGFTQVTDNVNKGTSVEANIVDGFFTIVDLAIANDNMSHATRTVATNPSCANVISAITTFFDTVTTALGTDSGGAGSVSSVTRTVAPGDQQCIDDVMKILRAFQYDLRYGGNQKIVEAANLYISGASGVQHVATEVTYTRAIFAAAKELAIDAVRNNLENGQFSQILPRSNGSITVDSSAPECANVVSALTTNWGILDNVLSSGNAYSGTVTNPDPLIVEQDANKYSFPLVNTFLDLPVIEASPYIQNSSLISFLGGSGCEIDGAKVATPNVPRPGLKQNAQGATVAQFDPQGKSMVANAFTIICFGGTAYNVSNDGYTQLVSVFAIFCQDGILTQSGGYASVTNSASNFGTYSLRATGFRAEAYSFDVGVIDSITEDLDGNGVATGRQVIQVSGTTLTGVPVEDYIIRIDGYTPTDPAVEHIILETELISGSAGSQIVAKITTNRSMDYSDGTNRYQSNSDPGFAAGSLPLSNLVNKTIRFHRPSVTNSSSHTWEYSGSGNTYAALPQNGGVGRGTAFEAAEEKFGQVYTSGTNEFGDFKVGNFVTIFNRTGAISFVGTVSISELSSIKIVGGDITITGFSKDDNLGGTFASDSLLPTQASVRDYISNNLGPYLNQPYSTNAVPSALVQLTSSGKINIDQIPALRPFNITSVASSAERLAIEDANAGDIAIETTATTFSVPAANVNTSNEQITIASHGVNTGDLLTYTQGSTAITGLSTGVDYYAIKVDDNTIKLATTESNATNNQAIDLQSQGAGTHQFKTQGTAISYILENDLESQFLAFTPNSNFQFTAGDIIVGSSTTARGVVQSYNDGTIFNFVISTAGDSYGGDFPLTISAPDDTVNGVQAVATANVVNGSVTKVTITNGGKGYYSQPTVQAQVSSGTTAVITAQIEGRVNIDIANNIKFDAGDFILDQANANEGTGTYSQSGTTITITENSHGLSNAALAYIDFTSGGASDGFYTISLINGNQYSVTSPSSGTNSGNMARKRIIDLSRVINTSAQNAANWTQLTSTNIDASNIVAGVVDPERLANKGVANAYSFLRGDSSWEYALQSIRPTTQDALVIGGSVTDSSYIDSITITNGGTGYTNGTYQNIPMGGGNISISSDNVARATYIVTGGTITSATVTDSGTGYTGDFSVTIPSELGGGSGAILAATKGTINRAFGNIEIDIKKGDNLTPSASVYGNYGVFRFRKDVTNQAIGNQDQGGFIIDNQGNVSIDQGAGSELNADRLDGNQGSFYQDAGNLTQGTLDPARLLNTTYAISISGTADTANLVFNETASLTSNPSPSQAGNGIGAALRNNNADGLNDGGTTHGVMTYRREATGNASTQLGFTDNNNLYIRGNSGGATNVYTNWEKIWSSSNDGAASGLDADVLDGKQGLWYQTGYNIGDTRGGITSPIGDMFLPEVLGQDKVVFENLYVNDTGNKFTLYIPDFHCNSGVGGNINNGGTYTIYSDIGATNNIGSIVVDASNGVQELTHTTGEIYSLVTGTIAFVGANSNANIYVFGPNPGTKWTVSSSNKISGGSTQIFGLRDNANGAKLQIGKAAVSTTPTVDFRSGGQAPNYDVQFLISGGNTSDGNGTIRINTGDITVNGNTMWHAGNDGSTSQLDAHYLDGYEQSTAATGNTIARRDASGHLTVNDLTGDQGIFTNNGAGTLSLADGNGITLGKSTTNTLALQGKGSSSVGYIKFGNDTNAFGWDGTHLSYNNVYFRSGYIGIGESNPGAPLEIKRDGSALNLWAEFTTGGTNDGRIMFGTDGGSPHMIFDDIANDSGWIIGADDANASWFCVKGFATPGDVSYISSQGSTGTCNLAIYQTTGRWFISKAGSTGSGSRLNVGGNIETDGKLISTVAIGTAPLQVTSTTEVPNLNANLLQGYNALGLPYLGASVNVWLSDDGGQERFYFANNSHTYLRTGNAFYFRNDSNNTFASFDSGGRIHFHEPGNDTTQSSYRVQVTGDNGLNINASESLSSGQKSTVLRAGGDKLWIDSYAIFKKNRNTVAENINVNTGDNCGSNGPITINSGTTVTINSGGQWTII